MFNCVYRNCPDEVILCDFIKAGGRASGRSWDAADQAQKRDICLDRIFAKASATKDALISAIEALDPSDPRLDGEPASLFADMGAKRPRAADDACPRFVATPDRVVNEAARWNEVQVEIERQKRADDNARAEEAIAEAQRRLGAEARARLAAEERAARAEAEAAKTRQSQGPSTSQTKPTKDRDNLFERKRNNRVNERVVNILAVENDEEYIDTKKMLAAEHHAKRMASLETQFSEANFDDVDNMSDLDEEEEDRLVQKALEEVRAARRR